MPRVFSYCLTCSTSKSVCCNSVWSDCGWTCIVAQEQKIRKNRETARRAKRGKHAANSWPGRAVTPTVRLVQAFSLPRCALADLEVFALKRELCLLAVSVRPVAKLITEPGCFQLQGRKLKALPEFERAFHKVAARQRCRFIGPRTSRVNA